MPTLRKASIVAGTALLALVIHTAAGSKQMYYPPGLPNILFETEQEAQAFDFGFRAATHTVVRACTERGYFGGGKVWFNCTPRKVSSS